jgi:hypothetical protein
VGRILTFSPARSDQLDARRLAIRPPRELRLALVACAFAIAIGTLIASGFELVFIPTIAGPQFIWLTAYLFQTQDRPWLVAVALLLLALALAPLPILSSRVMSFVARKPRTLVAILALCVFIGAVVGTHMVFHGYHMSRDEFLADFDAMIFGSGRFSAPIDPTWRPFRSALQTQFMLPIPNDVGFVSAYLPVNAGFRAVMGLIADSSWTSPLLVAVAVLATFGVARRLWPERLDAAVVSTLLVATSSQVLVTSMTSYAMTAHLALNMIWLWLFLRDDKIGHGAAIATGFLASGLHQLIFHPLFAAPFIVRLWISKRRSLAWVYIASYAAICLFWIAYWKLIVAWQGIPSEASDSTGPLYFLARVLLLLEDFQWAGADLILKNVLRFVAWQSPALLPLAVLAHPAIRRGPGPARDLTAGFLLTLVAMFILLPYQGHGWGYRYLHGLIGSLALLGGYGWIALTRRATEDEVGASRTMLALCSAIAVVVLLPAHILQARSLVLPYIRASHAIEQAATDLVIVDPSRLLFAEDLVRNDPFLRNRPKVLDLSKLSDTDIDRLCTQYSVATFDYGQAIALGITPNDHATQFGDDARARSRTLMSQRDCGSAPVVSTK